MTVTVTIRTRGWPARVSVETETGEGHESPLVDYDQDPNTEMTHHLTSTTTLIVVEHPPESPAAEDKDDENYGKGANLPAAGEGAKAQATSKPSKEARIENEERKLES